MTANQKYINPYRLFVGAFIPNWLASRSEVSDGAKIIYARLCQYAGQNGVCWPSYQCLSEETGKSRRQVIRCVNELIGHGLIETEAVIDQERGQRTNRFYFLFHQWMETQLKGSSVKKSAGFASHDRGDRSDTPDSQTQPTESTFKKPGGDIYDTPGVSEVTRGSVKNDMGPVTDLSPKENQGKRVLPKEKRKPPQPKFQSLKLTSEELSVTLANVFGRGVESLDRRELSAIKKLPEVSQKEWKQMEDWINSSASDRPPSLLKLVRNWGAYLDRSQQTSQPDLVVKSEPELFAPLRFQLKSPQTANLKLCRLWVSQLGSKDRQEFRKQLTGKSLRAFDLLVGELGGEL